jgi:hypothetical protein
MSPGRRPTRAPAPRPAPPKPAPPPRSFTSNVAGFGRAFASGAKNIATGAVQGAASLAKGGYALATSPQARAQAMQTGRAIANGAKGYAGQVYKDPKRALRDAQAGVTSMYNQFNAARKAAAARGESAEFWGNATAEIGSMLVPGGVLVKGARGARMLNAAAKAKNIVKAPVSVLPCGKAAPVLKKAASVAGKITAKTPPSRVAKASTKQSGKADRVVLGKWPGYITEAKKNGGIWFETPDGYFDSMKKEYGRKVNKQVWKSNEAFLRQQLSAGVKRIEFTEEGLMHAKSKPRSMTAREFRFLKREAGRYGYVKSGNAWIKKGRE